MKRLQKIPIEEAKKTKKKINREARVLEEYKGYINELAPYEGGKFEVENAKEAFAIRAGLRRAAIALGVKVTIRKSGNEIVFWVEQLDT